MRKAADGQTALDESLPKTNPICSSSISCCPGSTASRSRASCARTAQNFPILMLTARAETQDVVSGFDAGADDYLRKPFEIPELLSRVRALLKRTEAERQGGTFEASGVEVDPDSRRATVDGEPIELTAKEFDLLAYLVTNAGRVISRDEILDAVWGGQHSTDSNVIEVFVCHLRNKIGDRDNTVIQTIRGVGYFFARG